MSNPIEKTYGSPLQATVLRLLMDSTNTKAEITTFWLSAKILEQYPELKEVINNAEERRKLRRRIENTLKNLVNAGQLTYITKKAAVQTNYNVYTVKF